MHVGTKNKDNTRKEQTEGAWEAMSQIMIQQENERQLDTIRARVIEQSNWRQGRRKAHRTCVMDRRFRECRNCWKCMQACKDVQRVGNQVAEVGLKYFCLDYVSKNGVSVTPYLDTISIFVLILVNCPYLALPYVADLIMGALPDQGLSNYLRPIRPYQ